MGLSDEERHQRVFYSIRRLIALVDEAADFASREKYAPSVYSDVIKHGTAVLRSITSGNSNSSYWILGGALDKPYVDGNNMTGCAVYASLRNSDDFNRDTLPDLEHDPGTHQYDMASYMPEHDDKLAMRVLDVIESFRYSVNRYSDKLAESYRHVSHELAELEVRILATMSSSTNFGAAWLLRKASALALHDRVPMDDKLIALNKEFMLYRGLRCDRVPSLRGLRDRVKLLSEVDPDKVTIQQRFDLLMYAVREYLAREYRRGSFYRKDIDKMLAVASEFVATEAARQDILGLVESLPDDRVDAYQPYCAVLSYPEVLDENKPTTPAPASA